MAALDYDKIVDPQEVSNEFCLEDSFHSHIS